jgi:hypothetical protein
VGRVRGRGAPDEMLDLVSLAPPAFDDVHRLVRAVDRLKVPAGSAKKVDAFMDDLHGLDRTIREEGDIFVRDAPVDAVSDVAGGLISGVVDVEFSAKEAGLTCVTARERSALESAVKSPLYLAWLGWFRELVAKRLAPHREPIVGSPAQVQRTLKAEARTLLQLENRLDESVGPGAVRDEEVDFAVQFSTYRDAVTEAADRLRHRGIDAAFARRYNRRIQRLGAGLDRRYRRLVQAVARQIPAPPGPGQEEPEPA